VRNGGDQIEPIIFVAQSFNRFRIGKSGDDIFGYQPEPAVGIRERTVDLPKTGFDSDRTQLLPVIVEQEATSPIHTREGYNTLKTYNAVAALAVAGLIEAFVTPAPIPWLVKIAIGAGALALLWAYTLILGRSAVAAGSTGDLEEDEAGYVQPEAG